MHTPQAVSSQLPGSIYILHASTHPTIIETFGADRLTMVKYRHIPGYDVSFEDRQCYRQLLLFKNPSLNPGLLSTAVNSCGQQVWLL